MTKEEILVQLNNIEKYASKSKFYRLMVTPKKYIQGLFYHKIYYKLANKGVMKNVKTFLGDEIKVLLPSSMDIYLIGGKTHDSEIRLARFYVNYLSVNDDTLDIGSHIGYFAMLASYLTPQGLTIACEASPSTFLILEKNVQGHKNIKPLNIAISSKIEQIEFLEFPVLYSEYNTLEQAQYENEDWFKSITPNKVKISAQTATDIINEYHIHPKIIKIDVEGAEEKVIVGLKDFLKTNSPFIVMEFANKERGNENHVRAERLLNELNYLPYIINQFGILEKLLKNTSSYITEYQLTSDNIVYQREV